MEEWRTAPALMMAAIAAACRCAWFGARMGWEAAGRIRVAGLAGSFVCLVERCWRATHFWGCPCCAGGRSVSETGARKQQRDCSQAGTCFGERNARSRPQNPRDRPGEGARLTKEKDQKTAGEEQNKKESYLDAMEAAALRPDGGRTDLDEDPGCPRRAYVKEVRQQGLQPTPDELVGMRVQGIIAGIHSRDAKVFDSNLNIEELIGIESAGSYAGIYPRIPGVGAATECR